MGQRLDNLAGISAKTLQHYNERPPEFWEGTRDHDVTQSIETLLRHIRAAAPLRILDLGCGPGRDRAALRARGHEAIGLDGSPEFAAMARKHSGRGGRCSAYHDLTSWRAFVEAAGFAEIEHFYRPPGLPFERQSWLASAWRKVGKPE